MHYSVSAKTEKNNVSGPVNDAKEENDNFEIEYNRTANSSASEDKTEGQSKTAAETPSEKESEVVIKLKELFDVKEYKIN